MRLSWYLSFPNHLPKIKPLGGTYVSCPQNLHIGGDKTSPHHIPVYIQVETFERLPILHFERPGILYEPSLLGHENVPLAMNGMPIKTMTLKIEGIEDSLKWTFPGPPLVSDIYIRESISLNGSEYYYGSEKLDGQPWWFYGCYYHPQVSVDQIEMILFSVGCVGKKTCAHFIKSSQLLRHLSTPSTRKKSTLMIPEQEKAFLSWNLLNSLKTWKGPTGELLKHIDRKIIDDHFMVTLKK